MEYPNGMRHAFVPGADVRDLQFDVNGETQATYRRSEDGRSIEVSYQDGRREAFTFQDGRLVQARNSTCTVRFAYDPAGRLMSEDVDGEVVRYLRNEVGALVGIESPTGATVALVRDRDQRLTRIIDWNGEYYDISTPPSGPPTSISYPNGTTVTTSGNSTGLLSSWRVNSKGHSTLAAASWEYDHCDRVVSAIYDGVSRSYSYNPRGQLLAVRSSSPSYDERFELDTCGNRATVSGRRCDYDPTNRLLSQGERQFQYDSRGNLARDGSAGQASTYQYDRAGRLIRAQHKGASIEYAYDALGRRVRKRVGGITTRFHWAGTRLLSESVGDGQKVVTRDYLFCPEFLNPLAFRENSTTYYVHCGRLHEPLVVTDGGGEVVWKAQYLAFGRALVSHEAVRQSLRLPGHYFDEETELHYSVARFYAPDLGRYLSMDPLRAGGTSLNYYIYCDGDPVNRIDPTGQISLTLGTVLVAVGIGIAVGAAIGAGVELYRQRNQEHTDWGQVGTAAIIGGALGGIGAAVGVVAEAATLGALGIMGAGAAAGGLGAAAEYCVEAIGTGQFSAGELGTAVAIGASIGAVTAGIGGIVAARSRRAAAQAAEQAAREAEEKAAKEAATRVVKESPKPGTLSDVEARTWYHKQLDDIPKKIPESLSSEQQARLQIELRNKAKREARDLMADRAKAAELDRSDPIRPVDYYIEKGRAKGLDGEELWNYLKDSSQRSRESVDKSLGLERKP
jgi:RHS repeat-associated protein